VVVAGLLASAVAVHLAGGGTVAWLSNLLLVFGSLMVEAFPFVLLGAVVSAAIEVFVPSRVFARLGALPGPIQVPAAGLAGLAFPVCECGSVPVARRLILKGLSPAAAITFMLSAPVLNPIVLASTFVAYGGRGTMWLMVAGRAGLGLAAAISVGWVVGGRDHASLLRSSALESADDAPSAGTRGRGVAFFGHLSTDLLFMTRFLVLGAGLAAAVQTFVPQTFIGSVAGTPVLDLVVMMGLAALLSLCSESDAFVAASFVQFGPAAQLSFLVFGPLVDLKLGALYAGTFSRGFVRTVVVVVASVTLVGTLWVEAFVR
jgi:hypothetical protein